MAPVVFESHYKMYESTFGAYESTFHDGMLLELVTTAAHFCVLVRRKTGGNSQGNASSLCGVCYWVKNFAILFLHPLAEVFCEHLQFSDQKSVEIPENYSKNCQNWEKQKCQKTSILQKKS